MTNFGGFLLPLQYSASVSESHLFTRKSASLFDVSHMLQTKIYGRDCISCFEHITPSNVKGMKNGMSSLSVFLNQTGGIIDDLIVTKVSDEELYIVSNASRTEVDKVVMQEAVDNYKKIGKNVSLAFHDGRKALIALQGPRAISVLQPIVDINLNDLKFMSSNLACVAGVKECRITRCGYTGEDGVEISIPADKAQHIAEALLDSEDVKLAGLGARDSLRLEAGLCLYGNDIDENTTPVEASLAWLISKQRREAANFPGAEIILQQIRNGVQKRRVGIRLERGPPARKDAILVEKGTLKEVGRVTSGCPSPSLGGNVAMGYIAQSLKKVGTELLVNIRGKNMPCVVAKMPFVPTNYYVK